MPRFWVVIVVALASGCSSGQPDSQSAEQSSAIDWVNPFIGSGGRGWYAGSVFVGATTPFGLVQAGPDTRPANELVPWPFDHCSGYHAADNTIRAFTHTHLHGAGIPAFGVVGFMPIAGSFTNNSVTTGYASSFDKASETAEPGYYAVTLDRPGLKAELTTTTRAAHHRYTPIQGGAQSVTFLLDTAHVISLAKVLNSEISTQDGVTEGWTHVSSSFSGPFGGVRTYFSAKIRNTVSDAGLWGEGPERGAWNTVELAPGESLELQVGISYVSVENARVNRESEMPTWDFDGTRERARAQWSESLNHVQFQGGTDEQKTVMATSLYHLFQMPNIFSDIEGEYLGFDGAIHENTARPSYSTFSLWDTYRNVHPLLTLLVPNTQRDMVNSLLTMAEQGGYLPKWPLANGYTNVMIGSPAEIVIADSILKGLDGIDTEAAFAAMLKTADAVPPSDHAFEGRGGLSDYLKLGYVALDSVGESVSRTLEFAVADGAIANLAAALGKSEDAERFFKRAQNYRNLWDDESGYFRPRWSDGKWKDGFDPKVVISPLLSPPYTEGSAHQYLWMVPHDPEGLLELMGSAQVMVERLEAFFEGAVLEQAATPDFAEYDDLFWMGYTPTEYWHGNEPDIHAAYLFAVAGRPDLTQKWLNWIMNTLYHTGNTGIPGNDDAGTLAAWYVFSAMGFYPQAGSTQYIIGAPLFERMEVHMGSNTLVIRAPNVSTENIYVQSVTLNEQEITTPWLNHADLASGGVLHFEMGPAPSYWGRSE